MTSLANYLLVFLQSVAPMNGHLYYEKPEVTLARYESIAETIADVAVESPVFKDDVSGVKTALLLGSIATFEGAMRADIDACTKGGDIDKKGITHAWSLWQIHAPKEKVCVSRLAGARSAREIIRISFKDCAREQMLDRLSGYTDGVCKSNWNRSRHRMWRAMNWLEKNPFISD